MIFPTYCVTSSLPEPTSTSSRRSVPLLKIYLSASWERIEDFDGLLGDGGHHVLRSGTEKDFVDGLSRRPRFSDSLRPRPAFPDAGFQRALHRTLHSISNPQRDASRGAICRGFARR